MSKLSELSTVITIDSWIRYERNFKKKYKEETGESFKGSVAQYITSGVVKRKGLPDYEDEIELIKILNRDITEEQAIDKLTKWLENEENAVRGITGAFCDSCKDFNILIPIHPVITAEINDLENKINERANESTKDALEKMANLFKNLGINKNPDELEVDKNNTQENK